MAYKDEYEVARLLTQTGFERRVEAMFSGPVRLSYNLQPPFARLLGLKGKVRVGPWIRPVLKALSHFKVLRGTAIDPFGHLASRREERALVTWYEALLRDALALLQPGNATLVAQLLALPMEIRGYESVKSAAIAEARQRAEALLAQLPQPRTIPITPVPLAA